MALRAACRVALAACLTALAACLTARAAIAAQPASAALPDPYPGAAAAYAVAVDGRLIWAHDPDVRRAPASLTKLLTALVVLDDGWDAQAPLSVGTAATREPSPRAGLRAGERIRVLDALTAMLVHSANDACLVIVTHAAGGARGLAARMNALAAELGMTASHFVNPCGFDAPGQHSTARDLLRLARAAYANPVIAGIVARPEAVIHTLGGRPVALSSTNVLIGRLDGVIGIKTGHTRHAGDCLIALAQRSGHHVWLVMLGARQRWWMAHRMISDVFAVLDAAASLAPGA